MPYLIPLVRVPAGGDLNRGDADGDELTACDDAHNHPDGRGGDGAAGCVPATKRIQKAARGIRTWLWIFPSCAKLPPKNGIRKRGASA